MAFRLSAIFLITLAIAVPTCLKAEDAPFRFKQGSPDLCPQQAIDRLEVLPGYGWDNLRNIEMSEIVDPTYSECRVTADRKLLIPDQVQVHAIKLSDVRIYSEIIVNTTDYKSLDSNSINVHAGGGKKGLFSVSGSYSRDYIHTKENMINNRATTTRASYRYVFYRVRMNPDAPFKEAFKTRLRDMVHYQQMNQSDHAKYLAELLVRDYGTHIVTRVDVGLMLAQEDQILSEYYMSHERKSTKTTVKASAGFTFANAVGMKGGATYTHNVTKENLNEYTRNRTNTELKSFGGAPIGADFSINEWLKLAEDNLVTVDRAGDPLWYVVTIEALRMPEFSMEDTVALQNLIENAVETYYKFNTIRGCTSVDAPNFSYMANFDDGTCQNPTANFTFGGVFQTCEGQKCKPEYSLNNPLTGIASCPQPYKTIPLYEHLYHECTKVCYRKKTGGGWLHHHHHKDVCYDDCSQTTKNIALSKAYWCASTTPIGAQTGYMFGGLYSSNVVNPTTGDRSCPGRYTRLTIGDDVDRVTICVSDDYELDFRYSLPFAGFFTCHTGNPLTPNSGNVKLRATNGGLLNADPEVWPKHCPKDFSQHLVSVATDNCEMHYCVQAGALSNMELPLIRRPPFNSKPHTIMNASRIVWRPDDSYIHRSGIASKYTALTDKDEQTGTYPDDCGSDSCDRDPGSSGASTDDQPPPKHADDGGLTAGTTVAISVLSILLGITLLLTASLMAKRFRREKKETPWPVLIDNNHRSYGPIGDTET